MQSSDTFNFFMPIEISKGKANSTGAPEKMMFKGIASTADKDSDGENLMQEGFDLTPFQKFGFVNWDHQTKNNPAAIIGEPVLAEMRKGGMYVEVELYDTPLAKQVYDAAQVLANSNSKRSFGFSIEGKATERGSTDPKHPDYKIIKKAMITGLAITPAPKNRSTLAQIMKGEGGNADPFEFDMMADGDNAPQYIVNVERDGQHVLIDANLNIIIKKSMTTEADSGKPVVPESLDGVKNPAVVEQKTKCTKKGCKMKDGKCSCAEDKKISKSQVFENLFPYLSNDINKANDFFAIATHFEQQIDAENKHSYIMVSPEALELATNFINKFDPATIAKSVETAPLVAAQVEVVSAEDLAAAENTLRSIKKLTPEADLLKSEAAEAADVLEKGLLTAPLAQAAPDFTAMFSQLTEVISGVMTKQGEQFNAGLKSIETLVQTSLEKGDSQIEVLGRLSSSLEDLGNQPAGGRKSVGTSRYLEKGGQSNGASTMRTLSISTQKREIITLLDIESDITLEKGQITNIGNPDMANAMQVFESSSTLPAHIIQRIALNKNIQIVP